MAQWQFKTLSPSDYLSEDTIQGVLETFRDGFGLRAGWSIAGVRQAFARSAILGLLRNENEQIVGYAFYSAPDTLLMGTSFLWEDAVCIRKNYQGLKLTSHFLFEAIYHSFPEKTFGWIGGRTQNPLVIRRYGQLGSLYPFESDYQSPTGKTILEFLHQHIDEVQEAWSALDRRTGICRAIYPEGRLGDYPIQGEEFEKYEQKLNHWNFNRNDGDAIIVVSRLKQTIFT